VSSPSLTTRRDAIAACGVAVLALVTCATLMTAAVLAPAPAAVLPLLAIVCVGCPIAFAWSLPASLARLRAMEALRRQLARLPETQHPLGL
jgi:hypothetical protein